MFGLPSSQQLKRVEATNLWHLTLEIPASSRVEYKLEVVRGGHGEWRQDPLNANRARDPFGANSVAWACATEKRRLSNLGVDLRSDVRRYPFRRPPLTIVTT